MSSKSDTPRAKNYSFLQEKNEVSKIRRCILPSIVKMKKKKEG